ncbi:poly(3-hydroxybutyrate) depolymerase [Hahella sp. CCB-MM4]|uniref:polyhydroxyalkanoic acid system family protein n=1 Tax=Hahella sp. (strain CCB-MM4) TaxID=1926491 RepID=UPI000B9BF71C|nr:polyhydroxyalkanoic acid system family protein [Hahella sp. CCB-MM4]OZG74894.1 poly(3-hydroxybutyrate) depolymerase [Hahella sp. CCB-MM4]
MSVIEITRDHTMDIEHAKETANELAVSLSERFSVDYQWQDNVLKFKRSGIKGQLEVTPGKLHIRLELGLLVRPFKDRIEQEVHNHLDNMDGVV